MDDVLKQLHEGWNANLDQLCSLLRIPSVSADPARAGDVANCAAWLAAAFSEAGFRASVEPTAGHPVVVAEWRQAPPGAPTVLVYGHYDVQPAELADGWNTPPFEPQVRGAELFARGASDDKGQLFCHLVGARAHLQARGALPVNLVFLLEGEEEVGSAHLEPFLRANAARLACSAVVVSDSSQYAPGLPAVTYGLRGLVYLELTLHGPARDLHSGSFGGAVRNPANALAALLAALHDERGAVAVPGFYAGVRPLENWEREQFAALPFDEAGYRKTAGVSELWGEAGYSVLERVWARPTLDVNGLFSGYTGQGAKTVIPSRATAKLSCRLVPDQDPDAVAALLETHLQSRVPAGCRLEVARLHGARPVLVPVDAAAVQAGREALEAGFGAAPVLVREGGSIPVVEVFQSLLGAPVVLLGFGQPDDGAHGPNERIRLADLRGGMQASAWLWEICGRRATP